MPVDYFLYDELIRLRKRAVTEFERANDVVLQRFVALAALRSREGPSRLELIRVHNARCALRSVDADLTLVQQDFLNGWRERARIRPGAFDTVEPPGGRLLAAAPDGALVGRLHAACSNEHRYGEALPA